MHKWSVDNIAEFWSEVWEYTGVVSSQKWDEGGVVEQDKSMDQIPAWFKGARLNWAENTLANGNPDQVALIEASKLTRSVSILPGPQPS